MKNWLSRMRWKIVWMLGGYSDLQNAWNYQDGYNDGQAELLTAVTRCQKTSPTSVAIVFSNQTQANRFVAMVADIQNDHEAD